MTLDRLRKLCLARPGDDRTDPVGSGPGLQGRRQDVLRRVHREAAPNVTSFKCDDETFAELCERDGVIPAPYMARTKWVALERWDALDDRELEPLLETRLHARESRS